MSFGFENLIKRKDFKMEEIVMENIVPKQPVTKTWNYVEKQKRHVTHHSITLTGKRFSHAAEVREAGQAMKQRTDLNLENVKAVNSYYGLSRNIAAVIILAILAFVAFFGALAMVQVAIDEWDSEMEPAAFLFFIIPVLFIIFACNAYKKVKPAFILEIETVVPMGQVVSNRFAYGTATVDFSKKKHDVLLYVFLIVCFPIGIIYLLSKSKNNKYIFEMDEATGMEIVDTIGALLIKE